jgi:hypothetical protein
MCFNCFKSVGTLFCRNNLGKKNPRYVFREFVVFIELLRSVVCTLRLRRLWPQLRQQRELQL